LIEDDPILAVFVERERPAEARPRSRRSHIPITHWLASSLRKKRSF
jgi:hypothetical protein